MTGKRKILVTGVTGTVGSQVASQLLAAGAAVRGLARHPDQARWPDGIETAAGDLSDPASLTSALDGVESVFLVWPFVSPRAATRIGAATVAALARHADRIVHLSAEAAAARPESFWATIERQVQGSGAQWTVLRPTGFAKNTLIWAGQIAAGGVVRWPYGAAARALIDERDIAAVAARALTEDEHTGATYVLTGPETLTQAEQVRTIGEAIGRPLRWEEITPGEARPGLVAAFGDEAFADSALDTWASFVDRPERVTSTVQEVTGRPARPFRQWAADNAASFR